VHIFPLRNRGFLRFRLHQEAEICFSRRHQIELSLFLQSGEKDAILFIVFHEVLHY